MRSALLLFLLPGLEATDNAVCKVLSSFIDGLNSAPSLSCSCKSDGTALNIGGDAECDLAFGPPTGVEALKDMKITFHAGTTLRPCATPAMASVEAGITLPTLSSVEDICVSGVGECTQACKDNGYCKECTGTCTSLNGLMDTMVSTAIMEMEANADMMGEVAYDESTNKITVTMSVEAGKTKQIEVPIQKWGIADFFAKVSLTVEGSLSSLTTTQAVDLCMKAGGEEICGADIPKCDGSDEGSAAVGIAQAAICKGSDDFNWHTLFGAPPITMFPPQEMKFTDACEAASSSSTVAAPPPPPTVTLTMQASGSVSDYADTSAFSDYRQDGETVRSFTNVLKARIGWAACTMNKEYPGFFGKDCYDGIRGQGLKNYDSAIAVTITAASVIITAVITASSDSAAAELSDSLTAKLSTAEAASKEMGITIEAIPTVVVYSPASESSSSADGGAIAGAVISVLLFIGTIATVVYLVKKEHMVNPLNRLKEKLGADPLDRLKEKLGKVRQHILPTWKKVLPNSGSTPTEKGAAELATATPA